MIRITDVWVDDAGWLHVRPEDDAEIYTHVYRAGLCVSWEQESRSLLFSSAGSWTVEQCYERIVTAAKEELGLLLVLTPET